MYQCSRNKVAHHGRARAHGRTCTLIPTLCRARAHTSERARMWACGRARTPRHKYTTDRYTKTRACILARVYVRVQTYMHTYEKTPARDGNRRMRTHVHAHVHTREGTPVEGPASAYMDACEYDMRNRT